VSTVSTSRPARIPSAASNATCGSKPSIEVPAIAIFAGCASS